MEVSVKYRGSSGKKVYHSLELRNVLMEDFAKIDTKNSLIDRVVVEDGTFYGVDVVNADIVINTPTGLTLPHLAIFRYDICKQIQEIDYRKLVKVLPKVWKPEFGDALNFAKISTYYMISDIENTVKYYERDGMPCLSLVHESGYKGSFTTRRYFVKLLDATKGIITTNDSITSPTYFTGSCRNDTSSADGVIEFDDISILENHISKMRKLNWN